MDTDIVLLEPLLIDAVNMTMMFGSLLMRSLPIWPVLPLFVTCHLVVLDTGGYDMGQRLVRWSDPSIGNNDLTIGQKVRGRTCDEHAESSRD